MKKILLGFALGWTACRFWWNDTIEAADRIYEEQDPHVWDKDDEQIGEVADAFLKGANEAINIVVDLFSRMNKEQRDEILKNERDKDA